MKKVIQKKEISDTKEIDTYFKGMAPLEERKSNLFYLIGKLETESAKLYDEISDMHRDSNYNFERLKSRIDYLNELLDVVSNAYYYLYSIEYSSRNYAWGRFVLKEAFFGIFNMCVMSLNALVSLFPVYYLNSKAFKEFVAEIKEIKEKLRAFSDNSFEKIEKTIYNSNFILDGKHNKLNDKLKHDVNRECIIDANKYIDAYLNDLITLEEIDNIPYITKSMMINILNRDLNNDSTDLFELLDLLKSKKNSKIKILITTYTKK